MKGFSFRGYVWLAALVLLGAFWALVQLILEAGPA